MQVGASLYLVDALINVYQIWAERKARLVASSVDVAAMVAEDNQESDPLISHK